VLKSFRLCIPKTLSTFANRVAWGGFGTTVWDAEMLLEAGRGTLRERLHATEQVPVHPA